MPNRIGIISGISIIIGVALLCFSPPLAKSDTPAAITKQKLPRHQEDIQSEAARRSVARSFIGTPCGARPLARGKKERCGDHVCWDSKDGYRYCQKVGQ
jgi:hypothetical protein